MCSDQHPEVYLNVIANDCIRYASLGQHLNFPVRNDLFLLGHDFNRAVNHPFLTMGWV
jgi:hypothetical protein